MLCRLTLTADSFSLVYISASACAVVHFTVFLLRFFTRRRGAKQKFAVIIHYHLRIKSDCYVTKNHL